MQITINPKIVKRSISEMLECCVYDDYSAAALKAAGVPKKADLVEQLYADPKFMADLTKYLTNYVTDGDVIYDAACDAKCPDLSKLIRACQKAEEKVQNERRKEISDDDLVKARETLEAAGYCISRL